MKLHLCLVSVIILSFALNANGWSISNTTQGLRTAATNWWSFGKDIIFGEEDKQRQVGYDLVHNELNEHKIEDKEGFLSGLYNGVANRISSVRHRVHNALLGENNGEQKSYVKRLYENVKNRISKTGDFMFNKPREMVHNAYSSLSNDTKVIRERLHNILFKKDTRSILDENRIKEDIESVQHTLSNVKHTLEQGVKDTIAKEREAVSNVYNKVHDDIESVVNNMKATTKTIEENVEGYANRANDVAHTTYNKIHENVNSVQNSLPTMSDIGHTVSDFAEKAHDSLDNSVDKIRENTHEVVNNVVDKIREETNSLGEQKRYRRDVLQQNVQNGVNMGHVDVTNAYSEMENEAHMGGDNMKTTINGVIHNYATKAHETLISASNDLNKRAQGIASHLPGNLGLSVSGYIDKAHNALHATHEKIHERVDNVKHSIEKLGHDLKDTAALQKADINNAYHEIHQEIHENNSNMRNKRDIFTQNKFADEFHAVAGNTMATLDNVKEDLANYGIKGHDALIAAHHEIHDKVHGDNMRNNGRILNQNKFTKGLHNLVSNWITNLDNVKKGVEDYGIKAHDAFHGAYDEISHKAKDVVKSHLPSIGNIGESVSDYSIKANGTPHGANNDISHKTEDVLNDAYQGIHDSDTHIRTPRDIIEAIKNIHKEIKDYFRIAGEAVQVTHKEIHSGRVLPKTNIKENLHDFVNKGHEAMKVAFDDLHHRVHRTDARNKRDTLTQNNGLHAVAGNMMATMDNVKKGLVNYAIKGHDALIAAHHEIHQKVQGDNMRYKRDTHNQNALSGNAMATLHNVKKGLANYGIKGHDALIAAHHEIHQKVHGDNMRTKRDTLTHNKFTGGLHAVTGNVIATLDNVKKGLKNYGTKAHDALLAAHHEIHDKVHG